MPQEALEPLDLAVPQVPVVTPDQLVPGETLDPLDHLAGLVPQDQGDPQETGETLVQLDPLEGQEALVGVAYYAKRGALF